MLESHIGACKRLYVTLDETILTRVGMDQLGLVTSLQVPEDGSVIEIGQVDHVLALFKLRNRTFQFLSFQK